MASCQFKPTHTLNGESTVGSMIMNCLGKRGDVKHCVLKIKVEQLIWICLLVKRKR